MTDELKRLAEDMILAGDIYQKIGQDILYNHKSDSYDKFYVALNSHYKSPIVFDSVWAGILYAVVDEIWKTGESKLYMEPEVDDNKKAVEIEDEICDEYIEKGKKWCEVFR